MQLVEKIREYVWKNYLEPAKEKGMDQITIRAGDIHRGMELYQRMPAVCSALKTKIDDIYHVNIIKIRGPPSGQGANFYVTYKLI